jgi:hypothetical protein
MKMFRRSFAYRNSILLVFILVCLTTLVGSGRPSTSSSASADSYTKQQNGKSQKQFPKPSAVPAASAFSDPSVPLTPTITATLQDSFTDADGDLKAEPGQTLTYTVNITPSADPLGATGVAYNHSVDSHTSLVVSSIRTTPVARPDTYIAIGNVRIDVNTIVTGVLNNDSDADGDTFTASSAATSTNGGNVAMNANGTFTYNPPRGFEGTDTFTYTLTDSTGKTDTGIVSVVVSDVIWFINNAAAAGGDGRLTTPYNSIGAFQAVNNGTGSNPQTDDLIFIYRQSATDYVGSITLLNDQQVIGQGASQSLITIGGLTTPSGVNQLPATMGTSPNLTTTAAATNSINVAQNNFIRGVTLGNTTGADLAGTNFGTLTIGPTSGVSDVTLNGTGQALNLTNGTLAARISIISSEGAGTGIFLDATGGSLLTGSTSVTNATGIGINITDSNTGVAPPSSVAIDFANTNVSSSAGIGVILSNNTGVITFADLDIAPDSGQRAFVATNNTGMLTATSGDITTTGAGNRAVEIDGPAGRTPINLTFTSVTTSGASNSVWLIDTSGTKFQVTGTTQINTRAGTGIFVDNATTTNIQFGTTNIPNPSASGGYGIRVEDSSSVVTVASATISDANITTAQNDSNSDGIPDTDGDGDAIFLINNTGSFTLSGGALSNCGNDCIDLRNSSALTLALSAASISAPGQDVTAATGAGFGGHGISAINLTGTSSITGGTISGFNVGNRDGIYLTNNVATALTLFIQGTTFQNSTGNRGLGILGAGSANMTVTVGGPTNNPATNCIFQNISGTALQSVAGGSPGSTATVNLTVQNSTFQNAPTNGKNNLLASLVEAGKSNVIIQDNTFNNVFVTASTGEALININNDGTLAGNQLGLTLQRNTISNVGSAASNCGAGATRCNGPVNAVLVFIDDQANVPNTLVIDNNTITNVQQGGIFLDMANTGANASAVSAKITNNCIGKLRTGGTCGGADAPVGVGVGATIQSGIRVERRRNNSPGGNVLISGNTVRNGAGGAGSTLNSPGIFTRTKANSNLSVSVTNNNVDTNLTGGVAEMRFDTNANDAGDIVAPTQCDDINGNAFPAGAAAIIDINEINGTHNVEQTSAANVQAVNGGAVTVTADAGVSFNVACAVPPSAPDKTEVPEVGAASAANTGTFSDKQQVGEVIASEIGPPKEQRIGVSNDPTPIPQHPQKRSSEYTDAHSDNTNVAPLSGSYSMPAYALNRGDGLAYRLYRYQNASDWRTNDRHTAFRLDGLRLASQKKESGKDKLQPQGAGGTVSRTIGDIPQGKTVTITYDVVIDDPAGVTSISTQGTVSGTNFSPKVTDDPDTGTANDPTVTPIDLVDTATSVIADDTSIVAGDLVTFTATVARSAGSAGTITGTVQFKEDGNNLGSPVAVTGSGPFTAQLQTRCLTVGSHTITAVYSGDTNFKTSTGTQLAMQSVVKPPVVQVDDLFAGSADCQDLGSGNIFGRTAFATIAAGQAGVAAGGTVNVADGTYAENVTVGMDTLTLSGNVQITGNLTLSGGTFNSTSGTLSITGNFNQNGGIFNHTGGTVSMIGSAAQTLGGTVQTTFTNLTINNAAGVSLGINKTGVGILNLMNGNLDAGAFTYDLTADGTSTRTIGHVLGNPAVASAGLKKTFASTGAFTYHVGTANGYSPVTVTVTAGTGDLTVKAVQGPQPILNATKSLQRYWTLAGSGITVNMTFTYIDPTDLPAMPNEASYRVIRVSGGSAFIYLDSPPTSFVDETANTINVQNISGFSDWTAGEATGPTDAKLESFNATGYEGGTLIEWRTGFEVDNLGFNLYREEDGKRVAVNSQIVAGSALVAGSGVTLRAGQSYAWWDKDIADCRSPIADCRSAQYWLESVDLNGQSSWDGPFSSKFIGGGGPSRGNSSMLGRGESTQVGLTLPVERAALPQSLSPDRIALQSGLAGQAAVKMWVKREGFYRVTASELTGAGLDPRADTRLLQLYADGQQIPINVISDKDGLLFALEFYGRGLDAAFTDQRVYWLVSGSQPGLRIKQMKGGGRPADSKSFLYTAERKDRTIYFSALRNGELENFFGPVIAASPVDQSITIQHVDQSTTGTATLEVALQGVTTVPHKVWVYLNEVFVGETSFEGQSGAVSRFNIAQSLLRSGDNQVRFVAQAGPSDISLVDNIKLSYWHSFTADDNALRLTVGGNQEVTIGGFLSGAIRVLDVTDPDAPQELGAKIEQQKTGFAVTTASPGTGERRLLAITDDRTSKPAKLAANQTSALRTLAHAADFVIIARREFFSAIEPLRELRSKQGLKVEVADIEDVFDEFSFGSKSPQAVKDFLLYATTSWKGKPRYLLLVGDASYDAKNYLGLGDSDLIPTRLIDTSLMETSSDDALADFNADGIADLAVGRLAVRTPAEASAMVRKIIGYESSEPLESMLLVADINNGFDFETASTELRALIPGNLRVEQINRGQVGDAAAKSRLIDAITQGQKVVNYMGHGSVNLWSGSLLTNEDAGNLTNGERLPLFVMMTCLNGYFHDPALDSLAESLLKAENGGAVAVWTSAGMTEPGDQSVLNKQLYQLLFTAGNAMTLGEATAKAKAAVTDGDIRRTWVLLGDPTMRLK